MSEHNPQRLDALCEQFQTHPDENANAKIHLQDEDESQPHIETLKLSELRQAGF